MAIGDVIISGQQVGVGFDSVTNLSTLSVRTRQKFVLTGTVTIDTHSTTLVGTGTAFLSQVNVGDRLAVPDDQFDFNCRTVLAIASNTSLTVDNVFSGDGPGQTATVLPSAIRVDDGTGAPTMIVTDRGYLGIGTVTPSATGALSIDGPGTGDFNGCTVSLAIHTPENSDAWPIVMTGESNGKRPGVALSSPGGSVPSLTFSFFDGDQQFSDNLLTIDPSGIHLAAGIQAGTTWINGNYTVLDSDQAVYVADGTASNTVTLPATGGWTSTDGRAFTIFKQAGAGVVTITSTGGEKINGSTDPVKLTIPYTGLQVIQVGGQWVATVLNPQIVTVEIDADYTVRGTDRAVYVIDGTTDITVTLPASGAVGRELTIWRKAGARVVHVAPAGTDTINGTTTVRDLTVAYSGLRLMDSTGTWLASALSPV